MKLIVGLGNPGTKYENTRHNFGFLVLSKLVEKVGKEWENESRQNALTCRLKLGNEEVILALPQSYMNLSGEVVEDLLRWFKIETGELIVVHDELDLPFGEVQVKKSIGAAGHNGVKSIIERLGEDFIRIRIGIGKEDVVSAEKYVLEKFSNEEKEELDSIVEEVIDKIKLLVEYGYDEFISKYNV